MTRRLRGETDSVSSEIRSRVEAAERQAEVMAERVDAMVPVEPYVGRRVQYVLDVDYPGEVVGADITYIDPTMPPGEVRLKLVLDADRHIRVADHVMCARLGNGLGCWRPLPHETPAVPLKEL